MSDPAIRSPRRFYLVLAITLSLALVAGFARTFFLQPISGAPPVSPAQLLHGIAGSCWFALLVWQAWQVRAGRRAAHRRWGKAGPLIALAVLGTSAWVVADSLGGGASATTGLPRHRLLFLQLGTMGWFAGLALAAFLSTARPERHRRFIMLATVAMLAPAFARISQLWRDGGPPSFDSGLLAAIPIAALAWHDRQQQGKVHPVTLWAGCAYLVFIAMRSPIAQSAWWSAIAMRWVPGA